MIEDAAPLGLVALLGALVGSIQIESFQSGCRASLDDPGAVRRTILHGDDGRRSTRDGGGQYVADAIECLPVDAQIVSGERHPGLAVANTATLCAVCQRPAVLAKIL